MWNPKDDDESWEIKAFEDDTSNSMGATWPPRSYTCSICRREFRSAQALGGHMNVHRRDRVRLNQTPSLTPNTSPTFPNANSNLQIQYQEFIPNGGLCLLYSMPNNPNGIFNPTTIKISVDPSTLLSMSPLLTTNLMPSCTPLSSNFHVNRPQRISPSVDTSDGNSNDNNRDTNGSSKRDSAINEDHEIDLELRLGWRSSSSSTTTT